MSHETKAPFIGWPSRQSIGRRLLLAFAATTMLMALAATSASATYTAGTPLPAPIVDPETEGGGPSSVAVNQSTRDVYVGRWGTPILAKKGRVYRFSSSGTDLGCAFSPQPPYPGSVSINPENGNLYVVNIPGTASLTRLRTFSSACGSEIGTEFAVEASQERAIPQPATDATGNIYWPNPQGTTTGGKVEKITPTGTKTVLIEGLNRPTSTAFDSSGNLFVVTGPTTSSGCTGGKLVKFSLGGSLPKTLAEGSVFLEGSVSTVAIDKSTDSIFVGRGCGASFHVEKYSAGGTKLDDFGAGLFVTNGSTSIFNQLAVDETSGTVYAADPGHLQVQVFNFTPPTKQTLTVNVTGEGSVTGEGIACPGDCSEEYDQGKVVPLSATPNAGHKFAGWSGACSGTGSCEVTMSEAKSVTATFEAIPKYALTVNVSGEGSVTGEGIACPGDCSEEYNEGKVVSLSQTPNAGQKFAGWSGACSGTGSCEVTMSEAKSVTATFEAKGKYTLTVNKAGSGSGRITSSPWGINCGTHCAYSFEEGTVTLSAAIAEGSTFVGWTGCDSNPTLRSCVVNLASNRSVTAEYTSLKTITVNKTGSGSGRITSSPWGINCGTQCSHAYTTGTTLVLTAAVAEGSSFAGWTGCDAMPTLRTCEVSLNSDRTVTASYAQTHLLTVNKTGSGSGRVTSSPWGINCGAYCSVAYEAGTKVTLTAAVGASSSFGGWTGCDENPKPRECVVTMSADKSPTVTYNEAP